jgi:hypothetical protein
MAVVARSAEGSARMSFLVDTEMNMQFKIITGWDTGVEHSYNPPNDYATASCFKPQPSARAPTRTSYHRQPASLP